MKNLKGFIEFSKDLNESYYDFYSYDSKGGYIPPDQRGSRSGFKNTFGTGYGLDDLFGTGGALSRDRKGLRPDVSGGLKKAKERAVERWKSKKGFIDHFLGRGNSGGGGSSAEDISNQPGVSRLNRAGSSAGAAASGAASPQTSAPVPKGVGIESSDQKWKTLVSNMLSITPKPFLSETPSGSLPGGTFSTIMWSKQALKRAGMEESKAENFPLWIEITNVPVIGNMGKVNIISDSVEIQNGSDPKDMAIAEKIYDFWKGKNYEVTSPRRNSDGSSSGGTSSIAKVDVRYDITEPTKLKSDLQEMLNKFGVITSSQRMA